MLRLMLRVLPAIALLAILGLVAYDIVQDVVGNEDDSDSNEQSLKSPFDTIFPSAEGIDPDLGEFRLVGEYSEAVSDSWGLGWPAICNERTLRATLGDVKLVIRIHEFANRSEAVRDFEALMIEWRELYDEPADLASWKSRGFSSDWCSFTHCEEADQSFTCWSRHSPVPDAYEDGMVESHIVFLVGRYIGHYYVVDRNPYFDRQLTHRWEADPGARLVMWHAIEDAIVALGSTENQDSGPL